MDKEEEETLSDLELDLGLDAESLPLHNLRGGEEHTDAFADTSLAAPPSEESTKNSSTAYLDGLRGLAALLVYIYHHLSWFYGPLAPFVWGLGHEGESYLVQLPFIRTFFSGGAAAVAIFFVLSGYVLSISPLQKLQRGHARKCYTGLASAVVRRPFRLYLPVIGVSLAFAVCMHLPLGLAPRVGWPQPEESILAELQTWVSETLKLLNPFHLLGKPRPWYIYDPPAYTMPIEFAGSMLIFGLLAAFSCVSSRRIQLATLVVLGLIFMAFYQWAFAMFLVGMGLALNDVESYDVWIMSRCSGRTISTIQHVIFFVGWYLLCQPAGPSDPSTSYETPGWWTLSQLIPAIYWDKDYWRWWNTWGAMCLVYGVLKIPWLQRFFSSRPLALLGRLSFMLYLTQSPILWTFADRVYRLFGQTYRLQDNVTTWWDDRLPVPDRGIHGFTTRFVLSQIFILPVQFLVAHVATRVIDEPSIRVGRWVVAKLRIEK